ncbi:type VII secretion integral membrane protein EccD [Actinoplanes sp. HUAS TT8]|uniref:type VII secretion integral membrane protein EccD n=1 Tax=Actinoplanes sp. HUAS TT8 TaxID=3447453 RepID=UPI003F52172C
MTVVGAQRRADLVLPARAAIAEYIPALLELCGTVDDDATFPAVWSLAPAAARPFAPTATLAESGVTDGATLYLRDAAAGELDEPVVTDLAELVEAANRRGLRWDARLRALLALLLGLGLTVAGLIVLAAQSSPPAPAGLGAVAAGIAGALLARRAVSRGWPLPGPIPVILALAAIPLFAVGAAFLPAIRISPATVSAGLAIAVTLGAAVARFALPNLATTFALAASLLALPVGVVLALLELPAPRAAAVVVLIALGLIYVAPQLSGQLVASMSPLSGNNAIETMVARGRAVLLGLVVIGGLTVTGAATVLTVDGGPFSIALAASASAILVLRSGGLAVVPAALAALFSGVAGLVLTAVLSGATLAGWGPPAVAVAGLIAAGVGLSGTFRAAEEELVDALPEERSAVVRMAGTLLVAACLPLALGVFGVFGTLMDAGGRM